MMVSILTIRKTEKVLFIGLMAANTTVSGKMADNMVKVYLRRGKDLPEKAFGKMDQE